MNDLKVTYVDQHQQQWNTDSTLATFQVHLCSHTNALNSTQVCYHKYKLMDRDSKGHNAYVLNVLTNLTIRFFQFEVHSRYGI